MVTNYRHKTTNFDTHRVSIASVSEAMHRSRQFVLTVLSQKGFNTKEGFNTIITDEMLEVLADQYLKELHNFFNQANAGQVKKREKLNSFLNFRIHFKKEELSDLDYAQTWEQIDEQLIRQSFYRQVQPQNRTINTFNDVNSVLSRGLIQRLIQNKLDLLIEDFQSLKKEDPQTPNFSFKKQSQYLEYLDSILKNCTSGSTDRRYALLTPLTQRTESSGIPVRRLLSPHRYRIFRTTDDDDHLAISISVLNLRFTNCSYGQVSNANTQACRA